MSNLNAEQKLSSCEAVKHDAFKPQLWLIPKSALDEEAAVFEFGIAKHGLHNWRTNPQSWSKMISAAMRHLVDFNACQDFDKESGLHALAHVRARCAMLIEYMTTHPELDDRFKKSEPVVSMATEAQLAEWAKNANALQQQTAEENEQVRHMLKSIACLDVGQSKSPPWLMK